MDYRIYSIKIEFVTTLSIFISNESIGMLSNN